MPVYHSAPQILTVPCECQNGGTCVRPVVRGDQSMYECICDPGYTGTLCHVLFTSLFVISRSFSEYMYEHRILKVTEATSAIDKHVPIVAILVGLILQLLHQLRDFLTCSGKKGKLT